MELEYDTPTMEPNTTNGSDVSDITTVSWVATEKILKHLSEVQALRYFPVFVFLIIIMLVGTIGNSLVLFVYCKRFRKTSSNYFIVSMAIFDLLACLVGLPMEMYDLRNSFTFYNAAACKILRYSQSIGVYGSAIILIEIAFDRYYKICQPLRMIELYKIKIMCVAAGVVAIVVSIPALILFGISRSPTPDSSISGYDCSIAEEFRKKTFSKIYYLLLGIVFVVTVIILSALYFRIWIEIRRRKSLVIGDQISTGSQSGQKEDLSQTTSNRITTKKLRVRYCSDLSDDEAAESNFNLSIRPKLQSIAEAVTRIQISRTTVVLFAVTVAFVISYMPGIVIMICRSAIKDLESEQTVAEEILSKLFSKFYFINNAINPLIYSFLNLGFRKRCVILLKKLVLCKRRKVYRQPTPYPDKTDSQKSNKSTRNELV